MPIVENFISVMCNVNRYKLSKLVFYSFTNLNRKIFCSKLNYDKQTPNSRNIEKNSFQVVRDAR